MKIVIALMFAALIVAAIAWWRSLLRNRTVFIDAYPCGGATGEGSSDSGSGDSSGDGGGCGGGD